MMKKLISLILTVLLLIGVISSLSSCSLTNSQTVKEVNDLINSLLEDDSDTESLINYGSEDTSNSTDSQSTEDTSPAETETPETNAPQDSTEQTDIVDTDEVLTVEEDGVYDDKEHVALYIHTYGKLPSNYISKSAAEDLGWSGGSVERYAKGKCIGGQKFGNYEGLLPKAKGRTYYECDIDTLGKSSRGSKRIVYSSDGLIYYTEDHYESFELLYGEE